MRRSRRDGIGRACIGALACGVFVLGIACAPVAEPSTTFTDQFRAARDEGVLPWFCHSEGDGQDHVPELGQPHDYYDGTVKGDLTPEACADVAAFFDKAWATARRYPTRRDAQEAGALQAVQFMDGVGTHDVIPGVTSWQFNAPDPSRPFYLQYDGDGPDAPLAGMSWYVVRYEEGPPPGLLGDNDWWHTHSTICYTAVGTAVGNEISDEECARRGGVNMIWPYGWMLHAWIVPGYEYPYDVFAGGFGCVRGVGPAPAGDPCYDVHPAMEHGHVHVPAPDAVALSPPPAG